jgi:heme exporter protein D
MNNHDGFVFASYTASVLVISALILWIALGQRARKAELAALEQAGVKRRSDAA